MTETTLTFISETNITINIKNYFGDDESKISDLLAHLIEEEIVNPNGKIPNSEPNPEMSQAIQRALKRFLDSTKRISLCVLLLSK